MLHMHVAYVIKKLLTILIVLVPFKEMYIYIIIEQCIINCRCTPDIDFYPCTDDLLLKAKQSHCNLLNPENKQFSKFEKCVTADIERAMETYDACIIDFCAFHDTPDVEKYVCEGLEGYASQCQTMGIPINWRSDKICRTLIISFIKTIIHLWCLKKYISLTCITIHHSE